MDAKGVCECGHLQEFHTVTFSDPIDYVDTTEGCSICWDDDDMWSAEVCAEFTQKASSGKE